MNTNKTVCITGASSGFGEAAARALAAKGYRLVLGARNIEKLEELKQALVPQCEVAVHALDVTQPDSVNAFYNNLSEGFQPIDVLINNAGLALGMGPAHEGNVDDWETMINTNCSGVVRMTHAALQGMVKRNHGQIINIGSVAGNWPYPGGGTYGGTKAFVKQFSLGLRADLLGTKVRVTNLEPGMANTEFSKVRFKGNKTQADKVYEGTQPLTGEDIADTIAWLIELPEHVNVNTLEVMPTCQAWGPFAVNRDML